MNRIRVLVCGTNYGRAYIGAILRRADTFELVGVLAKGSRRSHQIAAQNGVPLYVDLREMRKDVDLACAAMSSSAWPVVIKLLGRGVHVLCEHPQRSAALKAGLLLASRQRIKFHLNGHFGDLPACICVSSGKRFPRSCTNDSARAASPAIANASAPSTSTAWLVEVIFRASPAACHASVALPKTASRRAALSSHIAPASLLSLRTAEPTARCVSSRALCRWPA